ncbi:hypothetical protein CspHIS471_0311440 [Cutaneotrichosporon sp. HIS471]|nr:hypothetical protein CspHIS471_0311440 [Cutaneotrichosporon sp. HIS471]
MPAPQPPPQSNAPQPPQSKPAYPRPVPSYTRPAPYDLHGRRKRKRKDAVPDPTPKPEPTAIDSVMLPHIVERILELATHESLVVLRGVNRALRERADARLAEHIVLRAPNPKMHGVYIHSRGLPTEFYGSVSDDIKLPGFAFFDGNAREPYSVSVQEQSRITFVNICKDTQLAVGLELEDDQGANGGYEAAFMRALEQCAIRQFEPLHFPAVDPTVDPVELLHRCVRVLSMEDWMAETSKDDREACLTFW